MNSSGELNPRFAATYPGDNPSLESFIPERISTALDVGCGHGGLAKRLAAHGILVDGVSWHAAELESASKFCRRVMQADVAQGLAGVEENAYDLVICSHLLEHIAYPQDLLRDCHRALRPGKYLLVAVPNLLFWTNRYKLLRGEWEYRESGVLDYTHLRWYTPASMTALLEEQGFAPEIFFAEGWVPLPGLKSLIGDRRRARINLAFSRRWPGLFGQQFIFRVLKRIPGDK